MPLTRSATWKKSGRSPTPTSIDAELSDGERDVSTRRLRDTGTSTPSRTIEEHIEWIQSSSQTILKEVNALRKKNRNLQNELIAVVEKNGESPGRKERGVEVSDLTRIQIAELEKTIRRLKERSHKQAKEIHRLKSMQLQEEVRDLTGTAAVQPNPNLDGIGEDPLSTRTDLLRRFSSLMVRNTIADDKSEACPICFETLEVEKCSAFECQHSICNNCLAEVSKGSGGIVKCPECRTESSSAEIKVVRMTEQDRWDKLLVIAQEWDAIDQRVIQDTSDDDKFIVDGTDSSDDADDFEGHSNNTDQNINPHLNSPVPNRETPSPPIRARSFSVSPMKEKRKILEQLAEERAHKKQRK